MNVLIDNPVFREQCCVRDRGWYTAGFTMAKRKGPNAESFILNCVASRDSEAVVEGPAHRSLPALALEVQGEDVYVALSAKDED